MVAHKTVAQKTVVIKQAFPKTFTLKVLGLVHARDSKDEVLVHARV